MKFWLQLDKNNVIRDCIEFEYGDYVEAELEMPLPNGIIAGYHKYIDGKLIEDEDLKSEFEERMRKYNRQEFEDLKSEVDALKRQVEEITSKDK